MVTVANISPNIFKKTAAGVWRIGETRVSLDSVVHAFNEGASAEEIVWRFPTLDLKEVYSAINYYLQNQDDVEKYLAHGKKQETKLNRELEARFSTAGLRQKLLSRRKARK